MSIVGTHGRPVRRPLGSSGGEWHPFGLGAFVLFVSTPFLALLKPQNTTNA